MTSLTVALTSHLITSSEPVSKSVWRAIREVVATGADGHETGEWASRNLSAPDAATVLARLASLAEVEEELESLRQIGIHALSELDEAYPVRWKEKLWRKHPALLFVAGDTSTFGLDLIGIVGSRDVDDDGAEFARQIAVQAVGEGFGVVSGGARGVDQIAMGAAHESGGTTLAILGDSLVKAVKQRAVAEAIESGRATLCTPFSPYAPFSVGNAMGRNKLIYASSIATVVVAASEGSGGTWAGAVEAIDGNISRVLVRSTGADGNEKLIRRGGTAIDDPGDLRALALRDEPAVQGALF